MDGLTLFCKLYPEVFLQPVFKVQALDGKTYRNSTMFKSVQRSDVLLNFGRWQEEGFKVLNRRYGDEFERRIGKPMAATDVRLAVKPVQEMQSVVFLDDVGGGLGAHLMVETSTDNFHAHFLLDRRCEANEILLIQKVLQRFFGGDPGALRKRQARRLPVPGLRVRINESLPVMSADRLISLSRVYFPDAGPGNSVVARPAPGQKMEGGIDESRTVGNVGAAFLALPDSLVRDIWLRKWKNNHKDDSAADFGLATYLIEKKGYNVGAVIDAIQVARDNLAQEKGDGAEWYLRHTAEKAAEEVEMRRIK